MPFPPPHVEGVQMGQSAVGDEGDQPASAPHSGGTAVEKKGLKPEASSLIRRP